MIRETIQKVVDGQDLTERETVDTMNEIMSGESDAGASCFVHHGSPNQGRDDRRNYWGRTRYARKIDKDSHQTPFGC